MTLTDGQYAIDDLTIGTDTPVGVKSLDRGDRTVYHQDSDVGGRYGIAMGRDRDGAPEWTLDLMVRANSRDEATAALREVAAVWHRTYGPGDLSVLRWMENGSPRRVYGRPRRWRDFTHPHLLDAGIAPALGTFQLADPRHFDDVTQSVTLAIVPADNSGFTFPMSFPWSTVGSSEPRVGAVTVMGDAPAPVTTTFRGPITAPWVAGPGWRIGLTGRLAYDQTVTVDALVGTATLTPGGASVGGRLTRQTRLRDAALRPGRQEITFGGIDDTGTATATITWRDAWWSL